jgi:pyruvate formate lyase activating enzyme
MPDKAIIFNIMRYSIHDGPGIRTAIFFKGCPLTCKWCHNPESLKMEPQKTYNPAKCIHCGRCARLTSKEWSNGNCPTGARETIGYETTIPALMKEINKDLLFYEQSGGGVTFSGGEPLFQAEFLLAALAQCKEDYINTAIDTSGYCEKDSLLKAANMANYVLYDIKFMDSVKHEKYCGASNAIILENLESLAKTKTKLFIRIPVIPAINDDILEMTRILNFIKPMKNIQAVHLLPYHNIQSSKYNRIGMEYELSDISNNESPNMSEIKKLFASKFRTKVGG